MVADCGGCLWWLFVVVVCGGCLWWLFVVVVVMVAWVDENDAHPLLT